MSKRSSLPSSIRSAALLVSLVCLVVLIVVLTDHDDEDSFPRCTGRWHSGTVDMVPAGTRPCVLDRTGHNTTGGTGFSPTTTPTRPTTKPANPKAPTQKQPSKPKAPAVKQPAAPKAPAPAPKRR